MSIEVYTGKPGNGKTALMVERLSEEAEKGERPLFAAGVDGLQPGMAAELVDPREWNAVKPGVAGDCNCTAGPPGHAHVVPDGSLIFVDEAWKWFGHLHDASRQATPPHVLQLAEHRHRGIDFVWTTQGPNQLYPFVRPLIADHYHVVRRFGTSMIDVFKWEELQDDVKSTSKREVALRTTRLLPSAVFGKYKSASQHTVKAKIPLRVLLVPVLAVAAAVCVWLVVQWLRPDVVRKRNEEALAKAGVVVSKQGQATLAGRVPLSSDEYRKAQLPRLPDQPWSAPLFDGRAVQADPQLFCMSYQRGEDAQGRTVEAGCRCVTEQGTPYPMDRDRCEYVALNGPPYNPYKRPIQDRSVEPAAQRERDLPAKSEAIAAPFVGGVIDGPDQSTLPASAVIPDPVSAGVVR